MATWERLEGGGAAWRLPGCPCLHPYLIWSILICWTTCRRIWTKLLRRLPQANLYVQDEVQVAFHPTLTRVW